MFTIRQLNVELYSTWIAIVLIYKIEYKMRYLTSSLLMREKDGAERSCFVNVLYKKKHGTKKQHIEWTNMGISLCYRGRFLVGIGTNDKQTLGTVRYMSYLALTSGKYILVRSRCTLYISYEMCFLAVSSGLAVFF